MAKATKRLGKGYWLVKDNGKTYKRKLSRKPIDNYRYIGAYATIGGKKKLVRKTKVFGN